MNKNIIVVSVLLAGAVGGTWLVTERAAADRQQAALQKLAAEWEVKQAALNAALLAAQNQSPSAPNIIRQTATTILSNQIAPEPIIAILQSLRVTENDSRSARLVIHQFETLADIGPAALPAIRDFLARNEEVDYEGQSSGRSGRDGRMQSNFLVPPSLRFGLMEITGRIGGAEAEKLLTDTLSTTGRGAEVAFLVRVLEKMVPGKYRDQALAAAHELLARPVNDQHTGLDRFDRNYLYGVLAFYNDASYAADAQAQVVRPNGNIDNAALRYLRQSLGTQALAFVAQTYADPRLTNPEEKEPLARYALNFAGDNPQANALYRAAINDNGLPLDSRRELIEDLNQDGIESERNPTARDLQLIRSRLALIAQYRQDPNTGDRVVQRAFDEAQKDLTHMLERAARPPKPPGQP